MRKLFNLFAAALVMMAAASCEKNEVLPDNNTEGKVVTLKASINNGGTKTSLGQGVWEEGDPKVYPVLWSEGDAIAVIQNGEIYKFVLSSVGNSGQTGTFVLDNPSSYQNKFDENEEIKAFYPYDGVSLESGNIKYNVPATQTYTTTIVNEVVCSTFGNGVSPMAAYAGNAAAGLSFENLFGVLKLQLKGAENEKVFGIEIISDNSLKGNAQLTIDDASSSISLTSTESSDKKVILKCMEGVLLSTPTDFLVALPANATNLKVLIHTNVGSYTKDIPVSNTNKIVAGQILLMPELTLGTSVDPIIYEENGLPLGNGIAISNSDGTFTIWAPVNCGYHHINFKYGKLYQWGRKDGHRYEPTNSGQGTPDAGGVTPVINRDYTLPETLDPNTMYSYLYINTWDDNPCPTGWRVPTSEEGKGLVGISSEFDNDKKGRWVIRENQKVLFLPFAGYLIHTSPFRDGLPVFGQYRGTKGTYWTSTGDGSNAFGIRLSSSDWIVDSYTLDRRNAYSVRCVKDMPQSQPMPGSN